jgi:hypothetical protein
VEVSTDGGKAWQAVTMPAKVTQVSAAAVDGMGREWVGGREGVFYSADHGKSWQTLKDLYVRNVNSIYYDAAGERMLVTSNGPATEAFAVQLATMRIDKWDTGWSLRFVRPVGDHSGGGDAVRRDCGATEDGGLAGAGGDQGRAVGRRFVCRGFPRRDLTTKMTVGIVSGCDGTALPRGRAVR